MIALLTACLVFEILVHVLNCISKSALKLCSATLNVSYFLFLISGSAELVLG